MITCKVGNTIINCFDGKYDKYTLKQWSDKNKLICPECRKPYEYCHGDVKNPYFRHKEKSKECDEIYHEKETDEHIKGKSILYEWLLDLQNKGVVSDLKLEAYIPETKQKPDLYFVSDGKRFVIEYQCSPIATEYYERHRLYELAGINDIWILGTDKYIEKSEIGKSFNEKEIERNTYFYLDSEYKIFIFNKLANLDTIKDYRIKRSNNYYEKNKRKLVDNKLLTFYTILRKYMIAINGIEFNNGNFLFTSEAIDIAKKYTEEIIQEEVKLQEFNIKCKSFLEKIFVYFKNQYNIEFNHMNCDFGFKYNKHYYKLTNVDNYPNINFCKIQYVDDKPLDNIVFNINIEIDGDDKIIEYLKFEFEEIINYKQRKINEFTTLQKELSKFNDKPLYLLFLEDNQIIDRNIKFKVIHDYPDNIMDIGKLILENLIFIKSKGADKYVLMIPRKRIRISKSFSLLYSHYTVRNYKSSVKNDFNELGLKFLEYKDLMEDKLLD